jgi:hypothetical protein
LSSFPWQWNTKKYFLIYFSWHYQTLKNNLFFMNLFFIKKFIKNENYFIVKRPRDLVICGLYFSYLMWSKHLNLKYLHFFFYISNGPDYSDCLTNKILSKEEEGGLSTILFAQYWKEISKRYVGLESWYVFFCFFMWTSELFYTYLN